MTINTIVHRKLRVLIGCALIIAVGILAGCGDTETVDTSTKTVVESECSSTLADYQACTITMPDTRRVTCITRGGTHGLAMSCDWIHADGSDRLE